MSEHWSGERPRYGKTIKVDNGLKAKSKRGDIGATWWSRRFIEVLESFGMGGRLTRGRTYARQGQVLSLSLSTSMVIALVQGSRPTPYKTRIAIKSFTGQEWQRIEHALAGKALYAAKLLAGEMPPDIETLFASLGLRLFPATQRELTMDCSCPDWEVPCKHLAATCYLLAESFDNDPFEILAWRGRSREDLLDRLRALRGSVRSTVVREEAPPLTRCLDTFWQRQTTSSLSLGDPTAAVRTDAVLDQLDGVPITVGGSSLAGLLRPAYLSLKPEE
ncbi:SWIM zinc finger family protein [Lentzea sp. NEAU-D7]|uniref:SWIM zinc finger family protein n=1 Tax=Lentzea sp. NEAU-D7 TaxID=2994667 RepID=UPI00224AD667|nr:SWIM zinc finger family protein [Lentzea sp. NEAU-D7]MCX2949772.1 SWIM zinc finger family protein [Lentzea sp. NEAU-D7]MCX2951100.1 SWIM zinc finger family protein [Lentzea sp. NEAU-D7]